MPRGRSWQGGLTQRRRSPVALPICRNIFMVSKAHQSTSGTGVHPYYNWFPCLLSANSSICLFLTAAYSLLDDSSSKPNARNVGYWYANSSHVTCLPWSQRQRGAYSVPLIYTRGSPLSTVLSLSTSLVTNQSQDSWSSRCISDYYVCEMRNSVFHLCATPIASSINDSGFQA